MTPDELNIREQMSAPASTAQVFPNRALRPGLPHLLTVLTMVFVADILAMFVMKWLALDSRLLESLVDATLVTAISYPVIYLFVSRSTVMALQIAEYQRVQVALRQSEEGHRALFESSRDAVIVAEPPEGRIASGNPAAVKMFGARNEDELATLTPSQRSPERQPDGRVSIEKSKELIETALREGSHKFEWTYRRLNGEEFPADVLMSRLERDGKVFYQATIRDITERKRAEQEIQRKKMFLLAVVHSSLDGILVVDERGQKVLQNQQFTELLKIPREIADNPDDAQQLNFVVNSTKRPQEFLDKVLYLNAHPHESSRDVVEFTDGRILDRSSSPVLGKDGTYYGRVWEFRDITELKRQEEARLRLATIVECSQDPIVSTDLEGIITSWNVAAECLYGYSPDEMIGQSITRIIPEERHHEAGEVLRQISSGDRVTSFESVSLAKGGRRIPVALTVSGIRDATCNIVGTSAFLHDITERQRVEEQLRLQGAALEAAANAIVITDADGVILWVNPAFTSLTGYSAREIIGKTHKAIKSGKHDASFYGFLWDTIRAGNVWHGEMINRRKDGSEYSEETTITPIRGLNGTIERYIAVKQDITERKRASFRLMESEERFREFAENVRLVFWIANANCSEILYVNTAFETVWGITAEEIYKNPHAWLDAIYPDDRARAGEMFGAWITGRGPEYDAEYRIVRPDGQIRWVRDWGFPIRNVAGQILRIAGIAEDVTEKKHAEQDRAVLEVQLLAAQKLEAIGQLAAGIAHEINTPMQYVGDNVRFLNESIDTMNPVWQQYRELLEASRNHAVTETMVQEAEAALKAADFGYLMDEMPKALQQTLEGVGRVSKIVGAMKEFSHPGSSEKGPVDLNRAIESTITVARNEWKYVAEMETDFATDLPLVPCLAGQFNQVILNIVVNAAHAIADVVGKSPTTKGKITVSTRNKGDFAEVRIRDTGTGIPETARARVFDPFFTTKVVGKGSGQGLAIARSVVVDKHGGTIHFETEMGKGTTFIIRLPLPAVAVPSEEKEHEKVHSSS